VLRLALAVVLGLMAAGADAKPFHSPHRYGYWFARPPIVVFDGGGLDVYWRLNKDVPKRRGHVFAAITANHAFGGFPPGIIATPGYGTACYSQVLDITRDMPQQPESIHLGELVTVRLSIAHHHAPLTVRVPLTARLSTPPADPSLVWDETKRYADQLGCPRIEPPGTVG